MRRKVVVLMGVSVITLLIAGTANATYVDFRFVRDEHGGRDREDLKVTGDLRVAPSPPNPVPIPPGGENCHKQALIVLEKRRGPGNWVEKGDDTTNNQGEFKILANDVEGKYRVVAENHLSGEKQCFTEISDTFRHRH